MDRRHAQLLRHELADEGQRLLGGRVRATGRCAHLIAIGPADAVAVMAIGDEHVVSGEDGLDRGDPVGIGHPLHDVLDLPRGRRWIGIQDPADRLAGFGEQFGEAARQGESPHRGQVRRSGPRQVQPVGRGLGRRPFVRQHSAGRFVDDFESAEHSGDVAGCSAGRR